MTHMTICWPDAHRHFYQGVTPQIAAAAKAAADFAAVNHTKDIQAQQVRTCKKHGGAEIDGCCWW